MPEYEITFRLKDRDDLPKKTVCIVAPDRDTARRQFLEERPRVIICAAPLEIRQA